MAQNTGLYVILSLFLIVLVSGIGTFVYYAQQTAAPSSPQAVENQEKQVADLKSGKIASIELYVEDKEAVDKSTKVQRAVYAIDESGNKVFDGDSSSTSARVTGNSNVGRTLDVWAFNNSGTKSYGEKFSFKVEEQSVQKEIPTHTALGGIPLMELYDKNSLTGKNISLGASQTDTFQKLRIQANESAKAFYLGGVFVDTAAGTNISNIDMSGMTTKGINLAKSTAGFGSSARQEKVNFHFKLDTPVLLKQWEDIYTAPVIIEADGDGCVVETIDFYVYDVNFFRSSKEGKFIEFGSETDSSTPEDVGVTDTNHYLRTYCKSS